MSHSHGHDHPPAKTVAVVKDFDAVGRALKDYGIVINRMNRGGLSVTGEITLDANAATTTMSDERLAVGSVVIFDPMTANAAAELYGGTMYVLTANRNNKSWVITHANNSQTDRTFNYAVLG